MRIKLRCKRHCDADAHSSTTDSDTSHSHGFKPDDTSARQLDPWTPEGRMTIMTEETRHIADCTREIIAAGSLLDPGFAAAVRDDLIQNGLASNSVLEELGLHPGTERDTAAPATADTNSQVPSRLPEPTLDFKQSSEKGSSVLQSTASERQSAHRHSRKVSQRRRFARYVRRILRCA